MPKVKISEYSATANSNTDVASINIDEGCAPSGINNAIRAVMGHLKDFQQGTNGDPFNGPVNGTVGATTPSTGAFTTLSATGNVTLGDASTDTLNVGNGDLIKNASGNLGLGVTPSAFGGGYKAFEVNAGSISATTGAGNLIVSNNSYFNGTNFIYKATGVASDHVQTGGQHWFRTAASGTAGNAITFTQAMTLNASGNLGITETSPAAKLHISVASAAVDGTKGVRITNPAGTVAVFECGSSGDSFIGTTSGSDFNIRTGNTVRATFDNAGNLLVGKTSTSATVAGFLVESQGDTYITAEGVEGKVLYLNRLTSDGDIVQFAQANTTEGSISVSGTTVTYGGGHLARFGQLPDGSQDPALLKGTVLTNLNEMCVWVNKETGIPADNEQCNKVKISDVDGDANVAGVFVSWTYDEQHDTNDLFVAMTGDMIIRIAQGVTVARGDLLMSAGDGTAKPQGDDIVRSKTVAKVTSTHVTCTYSDGSYCVPCVLMAC
jgi:hypothetical protein